MLQVDAVLMTSIWVLMQCSVHVGWSHDVLLAPHVPFCHLYVEVGDYTPACSLNLNMHIKCRCIPSGCKHGFFAHMCDLYTA